MPHTPPNEDDPDTLPPQDPPFYAEQALLGALLLQPWRLQEIPALEPEAFSSAAHAAVTAAILAIPPPGRVEHAETPAWLEAVLARAREDARDLPAADLHRLITACPDPRHATAYARTVLAGHARRRLRTAARDLEHAVQDASLPDPVAATLTAADALAAVIDEIATGVPGRPAHRTPTTAPGHHEGTHDETADDEEQLLLATATAHPDAIAEMTWLRGTDFTQPLHAALWRSLTSLARRGEFIDPVTVLCEAAQHRQPDAADPKDILDFLAHQAGSPQHWAHRVLRRSVLNTARATARHVQALADEPTSTSHRLAVSSRRALADLTSVRGRWHQATTPAAGPGTARPRATGTAPPRAGPPRPRARPASRPSR